MAITNKSSTDLSSKDYWRDASKELPRDGDIEYIIIKQKIIDNEMCRSIQVTSIWVSDDHKIYWNNLADYEMVTHWMPLSELPLPDE